MLSKVVWIVNYAQCLTRISLKFAPFMVLNFGLRMGIGRMLAVIFS